MSNILNEADLFLLFEKYFNVEYSKIGRNNLELIIEDFIDGGLDNSNFESPSGGHNYDLVASMSLIVGILQLLVATADYISNQKNKNNKPKPEAVINYIILNFPNQPTNKIIEKVEVINSIAKIIDEKQDENAK